MKQSRGYHVMHVRRYSADSTLMGKTSGRVFQPKMSPLALPQDHQSQSPQSSRREPVDTVGAKANCYQNGDACSDTKNNQCSTSIPSKEFLRTPELGLPRRESSPSLSSYTFQEAKPSGGHGRQASSPVPMKKLLVPSHKRTSSAVFLGDEPRADFLQPGGDQSRPSSSCSDRGSRSSSNTSGTRPRSGSLLPAKNASYPGHAQSKDAGVIRKGPDMEIQWMLDRPGKLPGMIRSPKDVCFVDDKTVAVAEERNARVQLFSARTGRGLGCIDRGAVPGLVGPSALCVSADRNHLLVADCSVVRYFNLNGEYEYAWPGETTSNGGKSSTGGQHQHLTNIRGLSTDSFDNLLIADCCGKKPGSHSVGIYCPDSGQCVRQLKLKSGQTYGEPSSVTCNRRLGLTYVSDSIKGCVYGFDKYGKHVFTFGKSGSGNGTGNHPPGSDLQCPLGMAVADNDNIYIADKGLNCVSVYSMLGGDRPLYHALIPEDLLHDPVAVSVGTQGRIAVTQETYDFGSDSFAVKVFRPNVKNSDPDMRKEVFHRIKVIASHNQGSSQFL